MEKHDHYTKLLTLLLLFIAISLIHCGGTSTKVSYPGMVTPQVQSEFQRVERQYRIKNYTHAYHGYENFIQTFEYNKLTDEAYYKQGKIFFLQSRLEDAANKFSELVRKTPSPEYKEKAKHMVAYAHYKQEHYDDVVRELKNVRTKFLPTKMRVQYYSLAIRSARHAQVDRDFGHYATLRLYDTYESYAGTSVRNLRGSDVVSFAQTKKLLQSWITTPLLISNIANWMKKYVTETPAHAFVLYKLGKTYFEGKKFSRAKQYLVRFIKKFPKNEYALNARKMLEEMGADDSDLSLEKAHYKVGVLVPLAGRYESFGYAVLDGVKCAAGINHTCHGNSGIQLIVKDAAYSANAINNAIHEFKRAGVVAIIGPLSSSMAIEAGITASELRIPIFPITQKSGLMTQGDYIFQVGMQPKEQIHAIFSTARSKGYRSFGVLHPNTNYGQTMAELFMEEVRLNGGRITALAEYNKWSKDVYAESRKLKKSIGRIDKPDRGIGFDAIFIPDSYQTVNAMAAALTHSGIKDVALIGTTAWNDPDLSLTLAENFPGSYFVDLYHGGSKQANVRQFNELFRHSYGRAPRVLEAYGYDIMMMIRETAADRGEGSIKKALVEGRGYQGVTGVKGFRAGDGPIIDSMIMTIKKTGITAH